MESNSTKLTREEFAALAAFRRALRKFLHFAEESARESGLTPQQHQVLLVLRADPKRDWASVGEIAEAPQLRHHATVGLVDRCQAAGLVTRTPSPTDRRIVQVSLTPSGEQILNDITERNIRELRPLAQLTKALEAVNED